MNVRFQDAPPQYDVRDQVELRRQVAAAFGQVGNSAPVVVLGALEITGGDASSTFAPADVIDGGTA